MKHLISSHLSVSSSVKASMAESDTFLSSVEVAAQLLITTIKNGGKIYSFGNGGSACDAMHFTEELTARFKRERPGISAFHLMDPGVLTCWANDYSFDTVFERQVETHCREGDIVCVIST